MRDYKHRIVAKEFLCRDLDGDEHVHHLNRDKSDNDRSNLIVISSTDHQKLHAAISSGFDSSELQKKWLIENGITFIELV